MRARGVWVVVLLAIGSCAAGRGDAPSTPARSPVRFDSVVIDAGHGGDDYGAVGGSGILEKDVVFDVSRRFARLLRERGYSVLETRTADLFVPLEKRTILANDARADLFISIHANSAAGTKPRGMEVYFASLDASDEGARAVADRENRVFQQASGAGNAVDPLVAIFGDMIAAETVREANAFARLAQARLDRVDRAASRGVKQAPFVVLLGVQMPAVLVEIGFLSNPADEQALSSPRRRAAIAAALEGAVVEYAERYDALRGVEDVGR